MFIEELLYIHCDNIGCSKCCIVVFVFNMSFVLLRNDVLTSGHTLL